MIVNKVFKQVLDNGLTVLVRPNPIIPKVSTQLWYNVGSKDERTGQKGIAHLIEHMIFKGTETLSESDINMITSKLSGYCNAFTSFDYTGYMFDFPSAHWHEALTIMADCMRNCTFKQEFLNSEMKAVIQELKMYKDNYPSSLIEHMVSAIFPDHPYHYPIIGFKKNLWNLKREALVEFYLEHYIPNNATLVVVGDVDPDDVFKKSNEAFGTIQPNLAYTKEEFYHSPDLVAQSVVLHRDVQQPIVMIAWMIPGARKRLNYLFDVIAWVLGSGKGSRLQSKLIDELQLATVLDVFTYDLFDYSLFFAYFQPKKASDIDTIINVITNEIETIIQEGVSAAELQRATKKTHTEYLSVLENNQKQAYVIGQSYLATQDEQFLFEYLNYPNELLNQHIKDLLKTYFRPSIMHRGVILPMSPGDKEYWHFVQGQSDQEDAKILGNIVRESPLQEGAQVHTIVAQKPSAFNFPRPQKFKLSNGLKVVAYNNPNIPTIEIVISMKGKSFYDPQEQQGLMSFMSSMLTEGTKQHPGQELAQAIEANGMSLDSSPGYLSMSMLSQDLEGGLSLLQEVLTSSSFDDNAIHKVREQLIADIKDYWDSPSEFAGQLARQAVYKNHPYAKNPIGSFETIGSIKKNDLINAYKKYISPIEATLAIVGDIAKYDVHSLLEKYLQSWQGKPIETIQFPPISALNQAAIDQVIARDQIVLCFTGLSIPRDHPDFDKILLFDHIFTGGSAGGMSSRLFQLRERSGLFYTIGGSLLKHTDEQPGMVYIQTIVSRDRLQEAEESILNTIHTATDSILDWELEEAKHAFAHSYVDNFESNKTIASTFLLLDRFNLPDDYFDHRSEQLVKVTKEEIIVAVKKILDTNKLITIKIGRL
jgi:zinc protease